MTPASEVSGLCGSFSQMTESVAPAKNRNASAREISARSSAGSSGVGSTARPIPSLAASQSGIGMCRLSRSRGRWAIRGRYRPRRMRALSALRSPLDAARPLRSGRDRPRGPRHSRRGPRRRDHQHRRRQRLADHVPGPARVRLPAGDRERLEQRSASSRARSRARSATARSCAASARARCWLGRASLLGGVDRRGAAAGAAGLVRSRRSCRCSSRSRSCSWCCSRGCRPAARAPRRRERARARAARLALAAVFGAGVYGGYFGAAQGILLLAILGVALDDDLQRINALKNVLAGLVNGVAGDDVRARRPRRLGAGGADRRRLDRRRPARRALRAAAARRRRCAR